MSNEKLNWYEFSQNNSGGIFTVDEKLCHRLFIEACTYEEAKQKALDMGVYFDGCDSGMDCPCCGDRWSDWEDKHEFPHSWDGKITFTTIEEYAQHLANEFGWTKPDARLFFKNGKTIEIFKKAKA